MCNTQPIDNREKILEAGLSLVRHSGLGALTMETAAEAAGITRKTVYNHFKNRDNLIHEISDYWMNCLLQTLNATVETPDLDVISKINKLLAESFAELANASGLLGLEQNRGYPDPQSLRLKQQYITRVKDLILGIVCRAQSDQLLRSDIPADHLSSILTILVTGLFAADQHLVSLPDRLVLLRESIIIMVWGLVTPKGREAFADSEMLEPPAAANSR